MVVLQSFERTLMPVHTVGVVHKTPPVCDWRSLLSQYTAFPACSLFASVRKYDVETFIVLYSPVTGSHTFFF